MTTEAKAPNIHQRMLEVMREVETLKRADWNEHHRYTFVSHDDVTHAIRRQFCRVGITQQVTIIGVSRLGEGPAERVLAIVNVKWINVDEPEDFVEVRGYSESQKNGKGGPTPQQIGAAVSYAVKMLQLKNFALVGDDSPDIDMEAYPAAPPAFEQAPYGEQPVPEPALSTFAYFAAGFAAVKDRQQLNQLMEDIASRRHELEPTEIKELTKLWKETDKRVS